MDEPLYEIRAFNDESLAYALSSDITPERVKDRLHFFYLRKYFSEEKGIGAKTLVIENDYISKAYITDYSNYYATCFQHYERKCKRVHFFGNEFSSEIFEKELLDNESKVLNDEHYLGYIVVKPLPDSILGPTLLKTYLKRKDKQRRYYPACHEYKVNLFGKELRLETLPYQEQDTVVSACASVAVWSTFHQTSWLFKTHLPSPSEITKLAGNHFINYGRTYPNEGLDITQICKAIDSVGLVSELRHSPNFEDDINLATRIIYAYLKANIPVILLIKDGKDEYEPAINTTECPEAVPKKKASKGNGHAITVAGYSEPGLLKKEDFPPKRQISLVADRIDVFYTHDDQLGPFSKYTFSGNTALLKHTWVDGNEITEPVWIHSVIIPLYPKIRIKYEDVLECISLFDIILYELNVFEFELEWDIYLTESNKYKAEILNTGLDVLVKKRKAFASLPKYIWIARAQVKGKPIFDFIIDATDIPTGNFCIDFLLHDPAFRTYLLAVMNDAKDTFIDEPDGPKLGKDAFNKIISELSAK